MSNDNRVFSLPKPIADKLRRVQRRMTGVGIVTAAVAAFAVLLAAMSLAMLVDYLATLYDSAWRGVLTSTALMAALVTLTGWAVLAWRRANHVESVAREVDRRLPHLEERWSTVANFAESAKNNPTGASVVHPAMYRQVADEAAAAEKHVDANEVVSLGGVVKAFLALNAVTVVLVLAAVADWRQTNVLFRRFWAPTANISATEILADPGDTVVGRGEPLLVTASLTGPAVDEATLFLSQQDTENEAKKSDNSKVDSITLVPKVSSPHKDFANTEDEASSVSHRFRSVEQSFIYRLRGGDGQTPWHDVTVADRPVIAAVKIEITPPKYRKEEVTNLTKLPRRLSAVSGSELVFAIQPKEKLQSLVLQLGDGAEASLTADADGWYRWRTELKSSLKLTPILTEPHGLRLRRPPTTQVHVYPDRPPVVQVISPNSEIAVTPDDTIEIDFIAEDDNGIGSAELVVMQEAVEPGEQPIELTTIPIDLGDQLGEKRVQGSTELDLSQYPLVDGAALSYAIRVVEQRVDQPLDQTTAQPRVASDPQRDSAASSGKPREKDAVESGTKIAADTPQPNAGAADNPAAKPKNELAEPPASREQLASDTPSAGDPNPPAGESAEAKPDAMTEDNAVPANTRTETLASENTNPAASPSSTNAAAKNEGGPSTEPGKLSKPGESLASDSAEPKGAESASPTATGQAPGSQKNKEGMLANSNGSKPVAETDAPAGETKSTVTDALAGEPKDMPADKTAEGEQTADGEQTPEANPTNRIAESRPQTLVASDSGDETEQQDAEPSNPAAPSGNSVAKESDISPNQGDQPTGGGKPSSIEPTASQLANNNRPPRNASPSNANNPAPNATSNSGAQSAQSNSQQMAAAARPGSPNSSSSQSPDNMTRRQLDIGGQTSSSNQMRVKVDKYAGSFAGQQRAKLEIALAPYLAEIEELVLRAQKLSRSVLDDLGADKGWQARHHRDVSAGDRSVKQAQEVIRKLQGRTHNTPYAFLGLQIADISAANLTPARDYLWKSLQEKDEERTGRIRQAWQQLGQALDRLSSLSQRYEQVKREYALADATHRIEKMYRVFVEDSFARPLGEAGDRGSPFSRKMVEFDLDEEYLARLQEVLEMQRELRAELAKILAEDPRLLRRFMNNFRQGADNLRNQLTELREQQDDLTQETKAWSATLDLAEDAKKKQKLALAVLARRRLEQPQELAREVGQMADRFEAWMPLDASGDKGKVADADLRAGLDEANALAADARELAVQSAKVAPNVTDPEAYNPALAQGQALYDRLRGFEVVLRRLGSSDAMAGDANFVVNRLAETRRLITATSSWNKRMGQLKAGRFHGAAAIEQYELATRTDALAGKLADLEPQLAGLLQTPDGTLPPSLANGARSLLQTLDEGATPNQLAAAIALERQLWTRIAQRQEAASEALAKAEEQFDELIKQAIVELDQLPVQDPIAQAQDDPTLDEILALLASESQLPDALGIPRRRSNLRIISDWLRPGDGSGGGGQMAMNQMRGDQQRMTRAARLAQRKALERIKKEARVARSKKPEKERPPAKATDWNVLVSTLENDLLQGRDKLPPEQYRAAIEQYRTIMNDVASKRKGPE